MLSNKNIGFQPPPRTLYDNQFVLSFIHTYLESSNFHLYIMIQYKYYNLINMNLVKSTFFYYINNLKNTLIIFINKMSLHTRAGDKVEIISVSGVFSETDYYLTIAQKLRE